MTNITTVIVMSSMCRHLWFTARWCATSQPSSLQPAQSAHRSYRTSKHGCGIDDTYLSILSSSKGRTAPDDRTAKHLLLPTKRSPRKAIGSSPGSCPPEMIGSSSQQGRKHARAQTWNVWIFGIWSSHALTQASYLEMSPLYCKCCWKPSSTAMRQRYEMTCII